MGAAPSVPGEESSLWSSTQSDIVWLAEEGDYASVDALLHQGADVRAQRGGDGESALIVAARNGDARLLKLLLSHSSASRSAIAAACACCRAFLRSACAAPAQASAFGACM